MNNFIDEQRSVYSLKESEINACTSKEELALISIEFNKDNKDNKDNND